MGFLKNEDTASVSVKVDGTELPLKAYADLLSVSVRDDVDAASMFELQLLTWDPDALTISWADDALFKVGAEVEIQFGYVDRLATVMVGDITGLELDFNAGETPTLTVRGYDRSHRMSRGQKTRVFAQARDSAIASQIAQSYGLRPSVVDTSVTFEYVMQNNQTDLEFLAERASLIGYELLVADRTLHFRPKEDGAPAQLTLSVDEDLIEFHPRLTAGGQAGKVEVRGWNPDDKQVIVGTASTGQESSMGELLGPRAADDAFGAATVIQVERPVFSQAEADQLALGLLLNMGRDFITGDGACFGRTDLESGRLVRIEGLGTRFSGVYDVVSVRHTYAPRKGYRTAFSVRKNAMS
ncbi:phage late control D family protein [Pyxidicoccus sp. 3LG]